MYDDNTRIKDLTVSQFRELCMSIFPSDAPGNDSKQERFVIHGIKGLAEYLGCGKTKAWAIINDPMYRKAVMRAGRQVVVDGNTLNRIMRQNNGNNH